MKKLNETIKKIEKIIEIYDKEVKNDLNEVYNEIIEKLREFFSDNKEAILLKYNLVTKNCRGKKNFFEITGRIKTPESLEEKLIRKESIFELANKENEEIKEELLKMDDLIGIRILGDLKCDLENIIKAIKDNCNILNGKNIKILNLECLDKPELMKNGKEIYKLKCEYIKIKSNQVFKFELQLKSKIDSIWGDMEHLFFYKNYDFYYDKEKNKKFMNNIGKLLEETEHLIEIIRNSNEENKIDIEALSFKIKISELLSEKLSVHFKSDFILQENLDLFYEMFSFEKENIDKLSELFNNDETLICESDSSLSRNYYKLRESNFLIPLIEQLYKFLVDNFQRINDDIIIDILKKIVKGRIRSEYKNNDICFNEREEKECSIFIELLKEDLKNETIVRNYLVSQEKFKQYLNIGKKIEEALEETKDKFEKIGNEWLSEEEKNRLEINMKKLILFREDIKFIENIEDILDIETILIELGKKLKELKVSGDYEDRNKSILGKYEALGGN
ncbi:hypothetical protein [uncultured Fusobacterium sp.]|uniref:hypothetical protein n=1 Tax=uncultured Fusobacterium sp. TaxID=159267 RepID=UPI0025CD2CFD|nr:hypothetical protein [uncultured Fusobacterium sp.]